MKVTLTGIEDVNNMLGKIAPNQAKNIMRSTVHGVAGTIRDDAKAAMPSDEGDMEAGTKSKRERGRHRWHVLSTVRVGGAFYWRFLEYGQGPDGIEYGFFMRAVDKFRQSMDQIFVAEFGKKWEAALARAAKRNGR